MEIKFLKHKAYNLRVSSLISTTEAGSGHLTSCLSAADIVTTLFFHTMNYDPQNPDNPNNDRFIMSKGHAAPLLYAAWKELGILTDKDLLSLRQFDSTLEGHPTRRFKHIEAATGSLGCGLSIGAGMALSARLDDSKFYTYVLLGDSEVAEGSVWEALEIASFYKLNNLVAILDCNRLGQSTETLYGHNLEEFNKRFQAFDWETIIIDGHDIPQIMDALEKSKHNKKPTIIIAKTIKGYGIKALEDKENFHGKALGKDKLQSALDELKVMDADTSFSWKPKIPPMTALKKNIASLPKPSYKLNEHISTRRAFGEALSELNNIVCLDAEVKNSTFTELFEKKHPKNFFQCFIAEQNMIGMATGLDIRGKNTFAATFGCFLTRAHDQIRMAAIGNSTMHLVGSHSGVSIGQDGPSQMGLEDIALMRSIPNSIILYPCDAISTWKLVEQMANYKNGISYLRTTRGETPVIYSSDEDFPIGGHKILRQHSNSEATIIAAGITVFEALKAHDILLKENIFVDIIDLYTIKPLNLKINTKHVITVEDHYLEGGLGEAVLYHLRNLHIVECLAVTKIPRSGKPEELFAYEGISVSDITRQVKLQIRKNKLV